jgi:hypothetical protein
MLNKPKLVYPSRKLNSYFRNLNKPVTLDPSTLLKYQEQIQAYTPLVRWNFLKAKKEAAVLLPLATVNGEASIIFTVRSTQLRTHQGEVR